MFSYVKVLLNYSHPQTTVITHLNNMIHLFLLDIRVQSAISALIRLIENHLQPRIRHSANIWQERISFIDHKKVRHSLPIGQNFLSCSSPFIMPPHHKHVNLYSIKAHLNRSTLNKYNPLFTLRKIIGLPQTPYQAHRRKIPLIKMIYAPPKSINHPVPDSSSLTCPFILKKKKK